MNHIELDRRSFLVSAGAFAGGMALSLSLVPSGAFAKSIDASANASPNSGPWEPGVGGVDLSAWIAIAPDDTVTVRVATPEVGNGVMTQTPMTVAEELGCDWSKVRAEFAPVRRDYLEQGIYAKGNGMQPFFSGHSTDAPRMQCALQVGASARERLKAAAAARWKVPVAQIDARNSVLTHIPTARQLRYGQVAAQAATIQLESEPALKPQSEWTLLGKSAPSKIHLPEVVRGSAVFGMDVRLPGMVYAALLQSPVQGGQLKHHDPSGVLKMPGVRAVVVIEPPKIPRPPPSEYKLLYGLPPTALQSAVAVIADHYWQAKKALEALPVEWDAGAGEAWESTEQMYEAAKALLDKPGEQVLRKVGDVSAVAAPIYVEATYLTPFCDQTPMEPLNGTAMVSAERVDLWHPAQDPQQAFWVAIDETGMAPKDVYVHQTYIGGAFGRRSFSEDARIVLAVAKQYPGVPVHVIWSREEMMRQGRYRTLIASRFKAGLDAQCMPQSLHAHACFAGLAFPFGLADAPYVTSGVIPNVHLVGSSLTTHVLTGAYRGPCYNSLAFMTETFIDECAVAAKVDPLEYRKRLLASWDPAWIRCLEVAADKSGWGEPLPKGQGRGIAISSWPMAGIRQAGSTVCVVATVQVTPEGTLSVKAIDLTFDCGRIVNRDAVAAQLEGAVIFALNMTLNEEMTLKHGAMVEGNFDQYPMLRMADVPLKINIHFDALSGHDRFAMIGEAPVGPVGPAVGNAIFQATGKRLRTTPFRKHDLSWSATL